MKKISLRLFKILGWNLIALLGAIAIFFPHDRLQQFCTLSLDVATVESDITWNHNTYDTVTTIPMINDLPKGSYEITLQISDSRDNDVVRLVGTAPISSIERSTPYCILSAHGDTYKISFETYATSNDISLLYYQNGEPIHFESIHLTTTSLMTWQYFGLWALVMIPFNLILLFWNRIDKRKWGLLLTIAAIASLPLFRGVITNGHDTLFHVSRIEGLKAGLLAGQFPVRVSAAQFNEYGYISSALYPESLLYFPAILRLLNVSIPITYCVFWFCIHLLTAYISWTSFHGLTGSRYSAAAGCILYTLLPFRLISVYLRGAFGEATALTFLPLVLWGVYEIFYRDYKKWPIAVIGYTGVLQCHILSITNTVILSIVFGLLSLPTLWKEKKRFAYIIALIGSVFFLNLWFLIPFLMLYQLPLWVKYMGGDFLGHVLLPRQLFQIILQGNGDSLALDQGIAGEMSFGIGLGLLFGLVIVVVHLLRHHRHTSLKKSLPAGAFLLISTLLYWTTTSWFPWKTINQLIGFFSSFLSNLPWRRLGTAGLFLTAATVCALCHYSKEWQRKFTILLTAGTLITGLSFLVAYPQTNRLLIAQNEDYGIGSEDELYLYFGTDIAAIKVRGNVLTLSDEQISASDYTKYFTNIQLSYDNPTAATGWIDLPLNYFPGYVAYTENGQPLSLSYGENNLIRLHLPAHTSGTVSVCYENCTMYRVATMVSLMYLILFIGYLILHKKHDVTMTISGIKRHLFVPHK